MDAKSAGIESCKTTKSNKSAAQKYNQIESEKINSVKNWLGNADKTVSLAEIIVVHPLIAQIDLGSARSVIIAATDHVRTPLGR